MIFYSLRCTNYSNEGRFRSSSF